MTSAAKEIDECEFGRVENAEAFLEDEKRGEEERRRGRIEGRGRVSVEKAALNSGEERGVRIWRLEEVGNRV